ncbi:ribosomal protection-like ABC-F family protein [Streptomyces sp. NBC_00986]|uniref:ribosomal protection-like ABC-F family protein n=1 Tax=Streptomyces sp. NBC_00986 TaxID=2903702 RepID=UPI0038705844|nr:ATP-binding cassette domain-containing protein [Streptomyces sp. NBC_00986]WSX64493.1 ATP-binding cassette domain-containing protein [Streptomyces sp. NBC_00986]
MRTHRPSSPAQLTLNDVTKCYGDRIVLHDVSLTIRPGEKAAVVGDNGSGKSTLLRLIAGVERPDGGDLTVEAPGGLAYLAQTLGLPPGATVQDAIDHALAELRALEAEMAAAEERMAALSAEELAAYGALRAEFEARGGYGADTRVDIALHGLGLPGLERGRRLDELSGGERSRLALAATLASGPELLLLDEPTNDLDDRATAWLEDRLRRHSGTVVVVTHDRTFLEAVAHTVLEVDDAAHTVHRYGNGYAGYLSAKAAARARWEQEYEDWLTEIDRQRRLSRTAGAQLATIGKRVALSNGGSGAARPRATSTGTSHKVRNANERLRRLHDEPVPRPPDPLHFSRAVRTTDDGELAQGPAVELRDVVVGDRLRVDDLRLAPGERLLVTGANGAGKTTLLRVIAGELPPGRGSVTRPRAVGHLRQLETAGLPGQTVLEAFAHGRPGLPEEYEEELLALGLFRPEALTASVDTLSTGQRRRLALARLVVRPVDLLLLDEPTNHLSPVLVEEVERALADYAGTLVVVSHDRRLRASFRGTRLELQAGRVLIPQPA